MQRIRRHELTYMRMKTVRLSSFLSDKLSICLFVSFSSLLFLDWLTFLNFFFALFRVYLHFVQCDRVRQGDEQPSQLSELARAQQVSQCPELSRAICSWQNKD